MRLLPMGERAILVEVQRLAQVLALRERLEASRPPGVTDVVPAARTVLVQIDPAVLSLAQARAWIAQSATADTPGGARAGAGAGDARASAGHAAAQERPARTARTHRIDVRYDGPDLDEIAEATGLGRGALIDRHIAARWTVAFTGFAPGFGYLVSDDWPFDIARRASPRTAVPAGAVGFAAEFCGVYPRETPGGWQLIGAAAAPLFDPNAAEPALLAPGDTVRFQVAT